MENVYSLMVGQCTENMVAKLEGLIEYNAIKDNVDVIKLFKAIKSLTYQFEGRRYHAMALDLAIQRSTRCTKAARL
jgi:hypothetical protein